MPPHRPAPRPLPPSPSPPPIPCSRTRGDGNCFYRSFLFGYLEHLLLSPDGGGERDRAITRLEALKKELTEVGGYDEIGARLPVVRAGRSPRAAFPASTPLPSPPACLPCAQSWRTLPTRPPMLPRPPPPVLETPVDMVLQLLRGVGSQVEPLTIEGLEATVRDEEIG